MLVIRKAQLTLRSDFKKITQRFNNFVMIV